MRCLYSLLLLAISVAPAVALPCEEARLRLDGLAKHVSVSVDRPSKLNVGSRNGVLTFDWAIEAGKVPDELPTYLILWSSAPVRFAGPGFFTLTADGVGPTGIDFGKQRTRAIIPMHNPTAERQGSIPVQVLRAGDIELHWGVVVSTPCGQLIGPQDSLMLSVSAGP